MFDNILFFASGFITVLGALAVVFMPNIVHACIALFFSLFGVVGLYACLGADFLAAIQLLVYAGGVIILMLFAIMLTGGSQEFINKYGIKKIASMGNRRTYFFAFIGTAFLFLLILKFTKIFSISSENLPPYEATVGKIGTLLVTDHVLAFEISSVLLIGALIGAVVIARPQRNKK